MSKSDTQILDGEVLVTIKKIVGITNGMVDPSVVYANVRALKHNIVLDDGFDIALEHILALKQLLGEECKYTKTIAFLDGLSANRCTDDNCKPVIEEMLRLIGNMVESDLIGLHPDNIYDIVEEYIDKHPICTRIHSMGSLERLYVSEDIDQVYKNILELVGNWASVDEEAMSDSWEGGQTIDPHPKHITLDLNTYKFEFADNINILRRVLMGLTSFMLEQDKTNLLREYVELIYKIIDNKGVPYADIPPRKVTEIMYNDRSIIIDTDDNLSANNKYMSIDDICDELRYINNMCGIKTNIANRKSLDNLSN